MKKLNVILTALLVALILSPAVFGAPAKGQRWEKLGERTVEARADKDVIPVGRGDGVFTAIQFQVDGSALVLFEVKVVFGDGQVFKPETRLVFDKNSRSRVIDLPGNKRIIQRVEFKYQDLPGGGKAKVELFGAEPAPEWEKLGVRTVEARADKDVIPVGRQDGVFSAIQFQVDGSALVLFEVKVVFGDGHKFEPQTRLVFDKNSRSRVIDLPGNKRIIQRVEFKYQDLPGGGKAKVELWGRK